ncbi:MAG: 5-(carboxyamino)imidazole ribonucleotide synthase [Elainella sp. Prado103]|nr:5-(carboxyamino)imidazole ribonucleotide synthase [Elainella sp. Prado103]
MKRVGVIGGGQLAWMMAPAAARLEIALIIQTPNATDPAVSIANETVLAPVADVAATAELAQRSDVITFENEFVDLPGLKQLEAQGVRFYPALSALQPLLDKWDQRSFLQHIGVPTPRFGAVQGDLTSEQLNAFGLPAVLKARRLGYDGQGTIVLKHLTDLPPIGSARTAEHWLLEEFVPFDCELAMMAARSINGEMVTYPVVETQQVNQVCQRVLVTAEVEPAVVEQMESIARLILAQLNYVGVMGIECFLTDDRQVLVNELAPRTHNSGHYSLDACVTSQFEQQLRAVCGLPLGSPALIHAGAVMVNLLGYEAATCDYAAQRHQLSQLPNAHLYWYGKTAARPGRKLGHVTVQIHLFKSTSENQQVRIKS